VPRFSASSTTHSRIGRSVGASDVAGEHHVRDAEQQVAAQRTAGMQDRELLAPESLDLEQSHGEGVTSASAA